ncbi:MAG: hypothetical protein KBB55_03325 [Candidatus Buchananbacteria bacterium]|nr:hypothetical protein [Candidatus Buchananbacteria bacterium]
MRTILDLLKCQGKQGEKDERFYEVEGTIRFIAGVDSLDQDSLKKAIYDTDAQYPWRDQNDHTHEPLPSIERLSDCKIHDPWCGMEYWYEFKISNGCGRVRKSQVLPYERYLMNLAEMLAKLELEGIGSVTCLVRTVRSKTFKI